LDAAPVLGIVGDGLYLVEIDESTRERVLLNLIDDCEVDEPGSLRIDLVFFGDAGGVFASSLDFLELWPKSAAELPTEVFVDDHYNAAFSPTDDGVVVTVRHARRPDGPPRRCLRFGAIQYEEAMTHLVRESRRLRAELLANAQQRAPHKLDALRESLERWPQS
jgi:hypothetical protein